MSRGRIDHIVLSIAGTKDEVDVYADASFLWLEPITTFTSDVRQAATTIYLLHQQFPDAQIVITGHSLGGAIAQLVADATGLTAVTFNAPGAARFTTNPEIEAALSRALGDLYVGEGSSNITNYRIYGDVVSQIGTQIGGEVTLKPPMSMSRIAAAAAAANSFNPARAAAGTIAIAAIALEMHKLKQLLNVTKADLITTPDQRDRVSPRVLLALKVAVAQGATLKMIWDGSAIISHTLWHWEIAGLKRDLGYVFDPSDGNMFYFVEDASSPRVASLTFPLFLDADGVFQLQTFTNGSWTTRGRFQELQTYNFGSNGVSRFRFLLFDSDTFLPLTNVPEFAFGLTFTSAGSFNARLYGFSQMTSVPEPQGLFMMAFGLLVLSLCKRCRQPA